MLAKVNRNLNRAYGYTQILRHGFWFVDIPRTSSSSVRSELGKQFGKTHGKVNIIEKEFQTGQIFADHLTAKEMKKRLGSFLWDRLFTFTLVRNPWERTLSIYFFRKKQGSIPGNWSFRDYVLALSEASETDKYFRYSGFRYGLADYITDESGKVIIAYVGRFETRDRDLSNIAKRLNCKELGQVSIMGASPKGKHYSNYYDEEMREIVGKKFWKDTELFGYEFERVGSRSIA